MGVRRKRGGFRRAGRIGAEQLGLPPAKARQLQLSCAWRRIAGEAIARRAPALRLQRGVLAISVPNGPWTPTLIELLPRLAGRLAAAYPELAVKKFKLVREGAASRAAALAVPPAEAEQPEIPAESRSEPVESRPDGEPVSRRLPEIARRYLARATGESPEGDPRP